MIAPRLSSPLRKRLLQVLSRMLELGFVSEEQHARAVREQDRAYYHGAIAEISAPYVAEMVRVQSLRLLGSEAYTGGYEVYTTIDSRLQSAANLSVAKGLEDFLKAEASKA